MCNLQNFVENLSFFSSIVYFNPCHDSSYSTLVSGASVLNSSIKSHCARSELVEEKTQRFHI